MKPQPVRRYSEAFKMQVISELENGKLRNQCEAQRKYGISGNATISNWLRKYGKHHLLTGVITMIQPQEADRIKQLEQENHKLKQALAEAHLEAKFSQAYFKIVCQQFGQDEEAIKKKHESQLLK